MREHKNFFRAAFDAMIEARSREAERMVAYYKSTVDLDAPETLKR